MIKFTRHILSPILCGIMVLGTYASAMAETINLQGTDYEAETLIHRDLGAGVIYKRLRIPAYPLNVNLLIMDMKNPYARIETTQGAETVGKTEALASASARLTAPGHKVLGGANANFWCVSNQLPHSSLLIGVTYGANVRNGEMVTETNMYSDQWVGGWLHSGVAAVDTENKVYVGHMAYYGTVSNEKIGSPEIIQVNKVCRDNEITLYNKFYGADKPFQPADVNASNNFQIVDGISTEVICDLDEGQSWLCASDIVATVKEIRTNAGRGTLGNHDFALVARGGWKEPMAKLQPGDKLTLNYGWSTEAGGKGLRPKITQAVSGCSMVMINGELTVYNDNQEYNYQIYSRTGYGTNSAGDKAVLIVIDKSGDPVYGPSSGCNTRIMCDILKHYGCSDAVNMDAGGSAEMLVEGSVINRTTEGNPRPVANGWLMISTAPEDNTVARLEFDSYKLEAPIYSSFRPVIIAYNKYGDIISHDFQDVELSCPPELGSCDGNVFTAAGKPFSGMLTASYGGVSVSRQLDVKQAQLSLRVKPILIDAARKYPIEVTATIDGKVFTYNPADLVWTIDNPSVATVENGILTGISNGTTRLTGTIGDYSDATDVTVEIAPDPAMSVTDFSGWTASGTSGITNVSVSPEGIVSFTYGAPRSPYIKVSGSHTFFSLPDRIEMTFTPSVEIEKILTNITLKDNLSDKGNPIRPADENTFAAGRSHTVEITIDADLDDLASFPVHLNGFTIYPTKNTAWKGEQTFRIDNITAFYENNSSGIENVIVDRDCAVVVSPCAANAGQQITVSAPYEISSVGIFNISGNMAADVKGGSTVTSFRAPAAPGLYILRICGASGVVSRKIIVK